MSNADVVLVTIHSRQHIPLVRLLGPILQPISIPRATAETLKAMGIDVRYHEPKDVKVNSQTGIRELKNDSDFDKAPQGAVVTPKTVQPEPVIRPVEITVPPVTEPTVLVGGEETPESDEEIEDVVVEPQSEEETQEDSDSEDTVDQSVDLTPDVEDEDTLTEEDEAAVLAEIEETEVASEEEEDLPVYDKKVYDGWTKAQLLSYLKGAEEYLPEEVYASLDTVNKTTLLDIVVEHILPLVEE